MTPDGNMPRALALFSALLIIDKSSSLALFLPDGGVACLSCSQSLLGCGQLPREPLDLLLELRLCEAELCCCWGG